jgi:hypothetical protein
MESDLKQLLSAWERLSNTMFSKETRKQVFNYLYSAERNAQYPTTTKSFFKGICDSVDISILIETILKWNTPIRNMYERISLAARILYFGMSGDRPGTIVESTRYRGSNEGLIWSDIEFLVFPDPDDPAHPLLFLLVKTRLAKGDRYDDASYKILPFYPESDEKRPLCIVSYFLSLALLDQVFQDVSTPEEVLSPALHPTKSHILSYKEEWKSRGVFRMLHRTNKGWEPHETKLVTASSHDCSLRAISRYAGFKREHSCSHPFVSSH